jgi:hypothetical protein
VDTTVTNTLEMRIRLTDSSYQHADRSSGFLRESPMSNESSQFNLVLSAPGTTATYQQIQFGLERKAWVKVSIRLKGHASLSGVATIDVSGVEQPYQLTVTNAGETYDFRVVSTDQSSPWNVITFGFSVTSGTLAAGQVTAELYVETDSAHKIVRDVGDHELTFHIVDLMSTEQLWLGALTSTSVTAVAKINLDDPSCVLACRDRSANTWVRSAARRASGRDRQDVRAPGLTANTAYTCRVEPGTRPAVGVDGERSPRSHPEQRGLHGRAHGRRIRGQQQRRVRRHTDVGRAVCHPPR